MKQKPNQEVRIFNSLISSHSLSLFGLVLFICMNSTLFRDFLLMAHDLDMINGEYVFVYLDIFRLMRYVRMQINELIECFVRF